jgi:hypothetical protein
MPTIRTARKIIINSTHYVKNSGNTYRYRFPSTFHSVQHKTFLSLAKLTMFNSTFNISDTLQNNTCTITWIDGTVASITIPNGAYEINELNAYLQKVMYRREWYVINTKTAEDTYFISLDMNTSLYKSEINVFSVPSREDALLIYNYVRPSNSAGAVTANWNFSLKLQNQNLQPKLTLCPKLGTLLGFDTTIKDTFGNETYVSSEATTWDAENTTFVSDNAPAMKPIFAYVLTCNMVDGGGLNSVDGVLAQLPVTGAIGQQMDDNSSSTKEQLSCHTGSYEHLIIKLFDQNLDPLSFLDHEISMTILIEEIYEVDDENNKNKNNRNK